MIKVNTDVRTLQSPDKIDVQPAIRAKPQHQCDFRWRT
jgi:hypothetical protein